jgi:hypothetical protein
MPWPMTLTPTNEAIRRDNCVEKNFDTEKINRQLLTPWVQPPLLDNVEDFNNVGNLFLVVPMGVNRHVEVGLSGSLTLKTWGSSLSVTVSITGTYGMGSRLLSCPFLHSESFNLSGVLRVVLILACCQSPVLHRSFLKEDFGGTHRNPAAWMVAWRFTQCKNFLVPGEKTCLCWFRTYNQLDGLTQK